MAYSKQDAAAALSTVEAVQRRTTILRGYERGAPYLFLWGVIWILGYTVSDLYPRQAGVLWLALNLGGVLGGICIQRAVRQTNGKNYKAIAQYIGVMVAAAVFVTATYFVLRPVYARQFDAFPALLVAFMYSLFGLWQGTRWLIAGGVLTALTMLGYAFLPMHFALWMAIVGGGTLLATGIWLRRG